MSDTSGNNLEREFECYAAITEAEGLLEAAMDIPQALNSITRAADLAERARKVAHQVRNIDLVEAIAELRMELVKSKSALADAGEKVTALKEDNARLKKRVQKLELAAKESVQFINDMYYTLEGDGPYCTGCFDSKTEFHRAVRHAVGYYRCPVCKQVYSHHKQRFNNTEAEDRK